MTEEYKSRRKRRQGVVVSNKMQKTITVRVERTLRHPHFAKVISTAKKYYAHCEDSQSLAIGQKVLIEETRPLSKLKRWRLVQVIN